MEKSERVFTAQTVDLLNRFSVGSTCFCYISIRDRQSKVKTSIEGPNKSC